MDKWMDIDSIMDKLWLVSVKDSASKAVSVYKYRT